MQAATGGTRKRFGGQPDGPQPLDDEFLSSECDPAEAPGASSPVGLPSARNVRDPRRASSTGELTSSDVRWFGRKASLDPGEPAEAEAQAPCAEAAGGSADGAQSEAERALPVPRTRAAIPFSTERIPPI